MIYPGIRRPRAEEVEGFFKTQVKPRMSAIYLPEQEEVSEEHFSNTRHLVGNIQFSILLSL